ncbi:MAG: citramalate synthase [Treponema sp.]|jgi:2-isopropylmalate synthase|nr:citramalate synthase [Treponema sp.]
MLIETQTDKDSPGVEVLGVEILDTTLRDGAQGEGITFSLADRLALIKTLDDLGVAWIEAGNPGSGRGEADFFRAARGVPLARARLCAFGATRRKGTSAAEDPQVQALLAAETPAVSIFGKGWDLHVTEVLGASLSENLDMISDTVRFCKERGRIVIFDAEHFFDGFTHNAAYALSAIGAAAAAGADCIALCDTNGGALPEGVAAAVREARAALDAGALPTYKWAGRGPALGIHAHDDGGLAVANSLAAVQAGAVQVQGTLLGFGERCGNACLAALIPTLCLKLGRPCLPSGGLARLAPAARALAEIANINLPGNTPYVGRSAFAHKAGMHADGILKTRRSFEHIDPALVGNGRRFLMSGAAGRSGLAERARKIEPSLTRDDEIIKTLAEKLKTLEAEGWQFDGADGSFELLVRRALGRYRPFFKIAAYRVTSEHPATGDLACSHGWVKVLVDGRYEVAASEGEGPVNAMDAALRRALSSFYPELARVRLSDYKVRVIDGTAATAAKVRVLIQSTDGETAWTTVGVSADIIDASRIALEDSIEYKLIRDRALAGE